MLRCWLWSRCTNTAWAHLFVGILFKKRKKFRARRQWELSWSKLDTRRGCPATCSFGDETHVAHVKELTHWADVNVKLRRQAELTSATGFWHWPQLGGLGDWELGTGGWGTGSWGTGSWGTGSWGTGSWGLGAGLRSHLFTPGCTSGSALM